MKQIWLIKIKNKILGPFRKEELVSMIQARKLTPNDEVNLPCHRWIYVRHCKELMELFDERTQATITRDILTPNKTFIRRLFKKKTAPIEAETASMPSLKSPAGDTKDLNLSSAKEVEFEIKVEETADEEPEDFDSFSNLDQIKKKAKAKSRLVINIFFAAAVLGAGAFYFFKIIGPSLRKESSLLIQARTTFEAGRYPEALLLFKKTKLKTNQDRERLASLLIQIEDNAYLAKRQLEKITTTNPRVLILRGLTQMKDQNIKKAEDFFKAAVEEEPYLASLNLALLKIKEGKSEEALPLLDSILDSAPEKTPAPAAAQDSPPFQNKILFLKALHEKKPQPLIEDGLIDSGKDYAQEASLLKHFKSEAFSTEGIASILDQNPYLTKEHPFDILSLNPAHLWRDELLPLCQSLFEKSPDSSHFLALYAFCQAQSGFSTQAMEKAQKALDQSPSNPLIQAVFSFVLSQNNIEDSSLAHIDRALQLNRNDEFLLPFILKARFCDKNKDSECSAKYWQKVRESK